MADTPTRLLGVYELQNYLKFLDGETESPYFRFTEVNSFEAEREDEEYETEYIERKNQTKYVMGSKLTIEFEEDVMLPGQLQAELLKREDASNIPIEYVRTCTYDPKTDSFVDETKLSAKRAKGTLNIKPLTGEAGSPAKVSGTLSISDEYEYGTFDETTSTFKPETEAQPSTQAASPAKASSTKD